MVHMQQKGNKILITIFWDTDLILNTPQVIINQSKFGAWGTYIKFTWYIIHIKKTIHCISFAKTTRPFYTSPEHDQYKHRFLSMVISISRAHKTDKTCMIVVFGFPFSYLCSQKCFLNVYLLENFGIFNLLESSD